MGRDVIHLVFKIQTIVFAALYIKVTSLIPWLGLHIGPLLLNLHAYEVMVCFCAISALTQCYTCSYTLSKLVIGGKYCLINGFLELVFPLTVSKYNEIYEVVVELGENPEIM